jgi:tetratricopeptide (TPR) repeat protein
MSVWMNRLCAVAAFLATGLLVAPCFAFDRLGTAGPIRTFGGGACKVDFPARMRGECDPPPVDSTLPSERRSQARVERALQLISVMRVEQAVHELDDAIAEDPLNRAALLLRARLRISGKLEDALRDVDRALQISPDDANALATRAYILSGLGKEGALPEATRALALDPQNVSALWIRSMILVRMGSLDEAEQDLSAAIARESDYPATLLSRAQIRMQIGKTAEASNDATAVIALGDDRRARQIRAIVAASSGDYAGALDDLNVILDRPKDQPVALATGRDFVDLYIQRALALTRIGKPAEAKRDLDAIVRFGGVRAVLQMQVYLRSHGFPDLKLDGARSDELDDALQACFVDNACGRGISIPG